VQGQGGGRKVENRGDRGQKNPLPEKGGVTAKRGNCISKKDLMRQEKGGLVPAGVTRKLAGKKKCAVFWRTGFYYLEEREREEKEESPRGKSPRRKKKGKVPKKRKK